MKKDLTFSVSEMIEKYQEATCPSCRSQIEVEARQKCWKDLDGNKYTLSELKKKWEVV